MSARPERPQSFDRHVRRLIVTTLFGLLSLTQAINTAQTITVQPATVKETDPTALPTTATTLTRSIVTLSTFAANNVAVQEFGKEVAFRLDFRSKNGTEITQIVNTSQYDTTTHATGYIDITTTTITSSSSSSSLFSAAGAAMGAGAAVLIASNGTEVEMGMEIGFHQYCSENRNSLAHLFTFVLYSVVCAVGVCGNTLVIWVVLRFSKMQTVTNVYILNLAIADECFLIGIPFLLYTMRICSWKFGKLMCKAYMVSTSITQFTSSIFLLIMAADRYIAVCHPIESTRYRTLNFAKLVTLIAWASSAVLMLPVMLFASTVKQADGVHYSCNIEWPESYKKHSGTTFILYAFLLGFATPLCFISCFYYLVVRKLHAVGQKHKSKERRRSHRKVTRLVLTVITVYVLCWLPHWISQVTLITSLGGHRELSRVEILLFLLFGCLAYSNSAMNPILYAFLSENFRKSFSKAFSCMAQQEVDAELLAEHSVYTRRKTRHSGHHQRSGAKGPSVQRPVVSVGQGDGTLAPDAANNSSSTVTSSTSTADRLSANVNRVQPNCGPTGRKDDKVTLVLTQDHNAGKFDVTLTQHSHEDALKQTNL